MLIIPGNDFSFLETNDPLNFLQLQSLPKVADEETRRRHTAFAIVWLSQPPLFITVQLVPDGSKKLRSCRFVLRRRRIASSSLRCSLPHRRETGNPRVLENLPRCCSGSSFFRLDFCQVGRKLRT